MFNHAEKENFMEQNNAPVAANAGNPAADPNVLDWHEIKNLGIDPAPAGLTEDEEEVQPN